MNVPLYKYGTIFLSTDGHLDCFQFFTVMNKAAMNIHVEVFQEYILAFLWGKHLGTGLLGHMHSFPDFRGNC